MKKDIHPKYHKNATIKCACGATYKIGSTKKNMEIEICANCHPFYTGKQKYVDTAGMVKKYEDRMKKSNAKKKKQETKKKEKTNDNEKGKESEKTYKNIKNIPKK